jgi:hypothetical protein
MIAQLNPTIPIIRVSDQLKGWTFLVIDYSQEHDLLFTCAMDNGELWTLNNKDIRIDKNISLNRNYERLDASNTNK